MSSPLDTERVKIPGSPESLILGATRNHRLKVKLETDRAASGELSFHDWATKHYYIIDKWQRYAEHPITFENHPYLEEIYRDETDKLVILKGAQIGMSEMCIARAFFWTGGLKLVTAYYFPTRDLLESYSHARIDTAINLSPELRDLVTNPDVKKILGVKATMNVKLKELNGRFIYFQGAQKRRQMIMVDADAIILDEFDEFSDEATAAIRQRLAGSPAKKELNLSTPKYPNTGIHEAYKETDRRVYMFRCHKCGKERPLEFPKSIIKNRRGEWIFACPLCGAEIDRLARGGKRARWVVTGERNNDVHGYHVPGMLSPGRTAESIMRDWQIAEAKGGARLAEFHWSALGIPFAPKGSQLTGEDLDACIATGPSGGVNAAYQIPVGAVKAAVMGVDVGRVLHVEIQEIPLGKNTAYTKPRVVYAGEIGNGSFDAREREVLDRLMEQYNVRLAVMDALPETRFTMDFVKKWRMKARAIRWRSDAKEHIAEGKNRQIMVNKTLAYDDRVRQIQMGSLLLPTNIRSVSGYYDQNIAPIRTREEKADGTVTHIYDNCQKADHYGDAGAYATLAYIMIADRAKRSGVLEYDKELDKLHGLAEQVETQKDIAKTDAISKAAVTEFGIDEFETKKKEIEQAEKTLAMYRELLMSKKGP